MENEKNLSPQESLSIIQTMLKKAHSESYNESGTSAIMWGIVTSVCGFVQAAEIYWNFYIGFDIWLLTVIAIIPQVYISISEVKNKIVRTYEEEFIGAVWIVFALTIFALAAYAHISPNALEKLFSAEKNQLLIKNLTDNTVQIWHPYALSICSLYLMIYAIPTLMTGLVTKFKPMIAGAILCYILFIISLYTSFTVGMVLMAVSGIFNWLIPGFILRRKYLRLGRKQYV